MRFNCRGCHQADIRLDILIHCDLAPTCSPLLRTSFLIPAVPDPFRGPRKESDCVSLALYAAPACDFLQTQIYQHPSTTWLLYVNSPSSYISDTHHLLPPSMLQQTTGWVFTTGVCLDQQFR